MFISNRNFVVGDIDANRPASLRLKCIGQYEKTCVRLGSGFAKVLMQCLCWFVISFFLFAWVVSAQAATPTTTTVSVSPNPVQVDTSLTATITVTGSNPTGQVCLKYDGNNGLGCVSLINGQATMNTGGAAHAFGSHTMTASYDGDATNANSVSAPVSYTVVGVSVKGNVGQVTLGQPVTLTATVGGNNPTGTITFMDGANVLGTVPLSGGQAVLTPTLTTAGFHSITVSYSGDANNPAGTSTWFTVNVVKPSTTTTVSISQNQVQIDSQITATITVTGSSNPTGQVCLKYDGNNGLGCVSLTNGQATMNTGGAAHAFGSHTMTASYDGDATNANSVSAPVSYTVVGVSVKADRGTVAQGQGVTLTAKVGGNNPTGTITFMDGANVLGTVLLSGGQAILTPTLTTSGFHSITVSYSGDANNAAGTSTSFTVYVLKKLSTTSVAVSPNPVPLGQPLTVTVTVTADQPTGSVCFTYDNGPSDCSRQLTSGQLIVTSPASATSTQGTHSLSVFFAGNPDTESSSEVVSYTVTSPNVLPTVSLTSPLNNANLAAPANITLTASASDSDGTIAKVEFFNGSTLLATVTQAPYTFNWANVAAGAYALTAKATDNQGGETTSAVVNITVGGNSANAYYVYPDHLNTPRAVTDQNGNAVWRWDNSDPFGGNVPNQDPNGTGDAFEFNLRFAGQYFDKETNLHYNYYRDYDLSTGRYIESDPIGLKAGPNTYAYVRGNPLNYSDPRGLWVASVEFYDLLGGGITFGKDPTTGQGFITLRLGVGLGGGVQYDPNGGRPGSDSYCKKNGEGGGTTVGWQVNAGGGASWMGAGVSGGVGGGAGYDFGSLSTYKDNLSPSYSAGYTPGGKTELGIGGSIGFEIGIYDKGVK